MHYKIWIASVALALGALPAGKAPAQPTGAGFTVQAPATLRQVGSPTVSPTTSDAIQPGQRPPAVSPKAERQALEAYGKLPLSFVPNAGQTNASIRLYAQGSGFRFAFLREEALFAFTRTEQGKTKGAAVALRFLGARPEAEPKGGRPGMGRVNYLLGNDPTQWRTNLPTYEEVVYPNLWPGIDLAFRGADGQLKYEFVLRPGAEVADIRLAYRGAEGLSLDGEGNLLVETPLGTLTDARPVTYQELRGERVPVASRYRLGNGERYGFTIGAYDRSRPLVIDPGLVYSTYLGGSGQDQGFAIAVDSAGNAYVTGSTQSATTNFPTTPGAFDTTFNGSSEAFVTKLNPAGSALVYSTYLGGSRRDIGTGIAVDLAGNAYVTGGTDSSDFPTTMGAFDTTFNGGFFNFDDAFVTKLNSTGSALVYSTYLGGSAFDAGSGIAIDAAGNAYVTGSTESTNFPTTPAAFDTTPPVVSGSSDAFVTKLNPAGSAPLLYSTYLGGITTDQGIGIAVDASDSAYVTGRTSSTDFPTTVLAFDTVHNGGLDAFVTKLNPAGSAPLLYSTFLGGSSNEFVFEITVDAAGNPYVTGQTDSTDFPTTTGAFDTTHNGSVDAFVTKLNPAGSAPLLYSTFLGGGGGAGGGGIAVDAAGNAYVTGLAGSGFPTTTGAFDTTFNGGAFDVFVTKLNSAGSGPLLYSTYLGGSASDQANAIALDAAGNAYVTGSTQSTNFPTTPGALIRPSTAPSTPS